MRILIAAALAAVAAFAFSGDAVFAKGHDNGVTNPSTGTGPAGPGGRGAQGDNDTSEDAQGALGQGFGQGGGNRNSSPGDPQGDDRSRSGGASD